MRLTYRNCPLRTGGLSMLRGKAQDARKKGNNMENRISRMLRRVTALVLVLALTVSPALAAAGTNKLKATTNLVDGLRFQNTISTNNSNRIESFSFELDKESEAEAILVQGSGSIYGAATISKAVSVGQNMGYQVLGAINTDFFSTKTGVPLGISIEGGVYKSCTEGEAAMTISDGTISLVESPKVSLFLTNNRTSVQTVPQFFNKRREDTGGVYLLNRDFSSSNTHTSTPGWFVRMKLVEEDRGRTLSVNGVLNLEVTEKIQGNQAIELQPDEYVLTAANECGYGEVFDSYEVGDRVTLQTICTDDALLKAQWAGGVGDIMVRDGAVTSSSNWTYKSGRAPRTALGVKEDGTLVLYAVDGRQSGYSSGLTEQDLAEEMRDRGCSWAVNLDGGGSTAISVWLPGKTGPTIRNIPSDGAPRSCATYLLLVTDQAGNGQPDRLALADDGTVVLTGSSVHLPDVVVLDSGMNRVEVPLTALSISSSQNLGTIDNEVYHAGATAGTDDIYLNDWNLDIYGQGQIHVVDALSTFTVSRQGSTSAVTSLSVKPGDTVQLAVSGTYWSRTALRDFGGVKWTSTGDAGTVDANGLYTAPKSGAGGTLTASAGGLSQKIQVTLGSTFKDVPASHWAYDAVQYCYDNGIVNGIGDGMFGISQNIRRCDFVLMIYNAMKKPAHSGKTTFSDVKSTDYYYDGVCWGAENGIINGPGDGTFNPTGIMTREQAFTILNRAMPLLGKTLPVGNIGDLSRFADYGQIADYALGHTATLVGSGLVQGSGDRLNPKNTLSRGEMAEMLRNALTFQPSEQTEPETPGTQEPTTPENPGGQEPTTPENPGGQEPTTPENPGGQEPTTPENPGTQEPTTPENPGTQEPEDPGTQQPLDPNRYTIALNRQDMTLTSGESFALTATLTPVPTSGILTWTCSDPTVAAITSNGVVTNLSTRSKAVAVTVTANWGGLTATCIVRCRPAKQIGTVIDAQNGLNVRSGPGTENAKTGSLQTGNCVVVLGEEDGWYHILYLTPDNQAAIGYVMGNYLNVTDNES